ncbi:YqcC family protein [Vibrio rumoiensis]|uniref:YqcC family protein n=1 Tax=Vibrio rumoiensis TaxID=76258 RepID=A0ABW7IST9_9VIBR|nr:YqcC family protein [Vibrio rumoiensis]
MSEYIELSDVLEQLEDKLIQLSLWEEQSPPKQDLNSEQPFSLDTLQPTQWLQWIFIPKMRELIASQSEVPIGFEVSAYFEQTMVNKTHRDELLPILNQLDETVR